MMGGIFLTDSVQLNKQLIEHNKQSLIIFSRTPLNDSQLEKLASFNFKVTHVNDVCKTCNKLLSEHLKIDVDHEKDFIFYESCDETLFKLH